MRDSAPCWTLSHRPCEAIAAHLASIAPKNAAGTPSAADILVPGSGEVGEIVEAAFWATLQRNEGRYPRFDLLIAPRERCRAAVPLPERRLSASAIAEFAPALEPGVSRLGVRRHEDGTLMLWGIVSDVMNYPLFSGTAPGRVVVRMGYENLAIFHREGYHFLVTDGHGLGRPQCAELVGRCRSSDQPPAQRIAAGVLLLMVVEAMRAQGNGGTILVLPDEGPGPSDLDFRSNPLNASLLSEQLDSYAKKIQNECPPEAHRLETIGPHIPAFNEYLSGFAPRRDPCLIRATHGIGALTGVDGAVVLTAGLDLLAFGAVILSPKETPRDQMLSDTIVRHSIDDLLRGVEHGQDTAIAEIGGTRHQSAARFVSRHNDALAITASHDGPLSIAVWVDSPAPPRVHLVTGVEQLLD